MAARAALASRSLMKVPRLRRVLAASVDLAQYRPADVRVTLPNVAFSGLLRLPSSIAITAPSEPGRAPDRLRDSVTLPALWERSDGFGLEGPV
jgi:hypothetical protein